MTATSDLETLRQLATVDSFAARQLEPCRRLPAPTAEPYPHSSECRRRDRDPAWELDWQRVCWKRGPCDGHPTCSISQVFDPRPPAPPRPSDEAVEPFEREHGRQHTEITLEVAAGDRLPSWLARCSACGQTYRWHREAAEHYVAHDARISDRPIAATLADVAPLPAEDPELAVFEEIGRELGRVAATKALLARLKR